MFLGNNIAIWLFILCQSLKQGQVQKGVLSNSTSMYLKALTRTFLIRLAISKNLYSTLLFYFFRDTSTNFEDQLLGVCMIDYKLCLVVTPKMLLQCRMGKHSIRQILGYIYQRPSSVETFPIKILGDYKQTQCKIEYKDRLISLLAF